jgi:hypothetical protein
VNDLEARLIALADDVAFPATPALEAPVRAAIAREPRRRRRAQLRLVLVLAVLAALAGLALSPGARSAVLRFFGFGAVRVELRHAPLPPPRTTLDRLTLGRPATLAEARRLLGAPPPLPVVLGPPDAVYVDADGRVSVVYAPGPARPPAVAPGIAVLVSVLRGHDVTAKFVADSGSEPSFVTVGRYTGFFVAAPHEVASLRPDGSLRQETLRLAAPTLIVQANEYTVRLEARTTEAELVSYAETIP